MAQLESFQYGDLVVSRKGPSEAPYVLELNERHHANDVRIMMNVSEAIGLALDVLNCLDLTEELYTKVQAELEKKG